MTKTFAMDGSAEDYHRFLGSFIGSYAGLEFLVREALTEHSRLSPEHFSILLGFPKTAETLGKLRKLYRLQVQDEALLKRQDQAYAQLAALTQLRDWLVHYGAEPRGDGTVMVRMKPTEQSVATGAAHHDFKSAELWGAAGDLTQISAFIGFEMLVPFARQGRVTVKPPAMPPFAWQYKSPARPRT